MNPQSGPSLSEAALVHNVVSGVHGALEELSRRYRNELLNICQSIAPSLSLEEREKVFQTFLETIRRDPASAFANYKSRSALAAYLTALLANHLAPRVLSVVRLDASQGFNVLQQLFGETLRRAVKQYFFSQKSEDDGRTQDDVYHDVLVHLMENSGRRLLAFDGKGAFTAYLRKIVRNYWLDSVRQREGRKRLPEAIQALPPLEQEAFRFIAWEGLSGQEAVDRLRSTLGAGKSEDFIQEAIDRIIPKIPPPAPRGAKIVTATTLPEPDPDVVSALLRWQRIRSPESELLTRIRQRELDAALERLRNAIKNLPAEQRSFLVHRYFAETPLTPREIARRWARPVEQVYEIGRRAMASLRTKVKELGLEGLEL